MLAIEPVFDKLLINWHDLQFFEVLLCCLSILNEKCQWDNYSC